MLLESLLQIKKELNAFVKPLSNNKDRVEIASVNKEDMAKAAANSLNDKILLSIINLEEERILQSNAPYMKRNGDHFDSYNPELHLNVYILVAINFDKYDESLKHLSYVLRFFQWKNVFEEIEDSNNVVVIEKLMLDLQTLTIDQVGQLWQMIGGKFMTFALYKARMVVILEEKEPDSKIPITEMDFSLQLK